MRHRKKKYTLDRKRAARSSLVKNLATQLILYEKVTTTDAKAKVVRSYVERLITKGKRNTLASRRELMRHLSLELAVKKVLETLSPRFGERSGGYTRITKMGARVGDGAAVSRVEFVS